MDEAPPPPPPGVDTGYISLNYFTLAFFFVIIAIMAILLVLIACRCFRRRRLILVDGRLTPPRSRSEADIDVERGLDTSVFTPVTIPVKKAIIVLQPDGEHSIALSSEILQMDAAIQVRESELQPIPLSWRRSRSASAAQLYGFLDTEDQQQSTREEDSCVRKTGSSNRIHRSASTASCSRAATAESPIATPRHQQNDGRSVVLNIIHNNDDNESIVAIDIMELQAEKSGEIEAIDSNNSLLTAETGGDGMATSKEDGCLPEEPRRRRRRRRSRRYVDVACQTDESIAR